MKLYCLLKEFLVLRVMYFKIIESRARKDAEVGKTLVSLMDRSYHYAMKWMNVLAALYICTLITWPCGDSALEEDHSNGYNAVSSSPEGNDFESDGCSVYCFCCCCGQQIVRPFQAPRNVQLLQTSLLLLIPNNPYNSPTFPQWQPPKVTVS